MSLFLHLLRPLYDGDLKVLVADGELLFSRPGFDLGDDMERIADIDQPHAHIDTEKIGI